MMPSAKLPPSVLEAGLLGSLTTPERLTKMQLYGIVEGDFKVWPLVYVFIAEYHAKHGTMPLAALIKQSWPDWDPQVGEFEYWLEEFSVHATALRAESVIRDSLDAVGTDPESAIPKLIGDLASVTYAGSTHVVSTDASIGSRYDLFLKRAAIYEATGGNYLHGISTGFDIIDGTRQGWMGGELVGFYARPTVGKTWMLVREAAVAWASGYRVLLISPEVSARTVALRIDVFLGHYKGIQLSHEAIFAGDPAYSNRYKELVAAVEDSQSWWTVDSLHGQPLKVSDIRALAQQLQPDIICIDGVMLMDDDKRGEGWQKMENICYGLKNLATALDIVIMMSHQAVNLSKGKRHTGAQGRGDDFTMPSLNDASGGEGFVRACTTVFTMAPDQYQPHLRWYSIRKSRERNFKNWKPRYAMLWDVDSGHIRDLSDHGEDLILISNELKAYGLWEGEDE